VEAYRYRNCMGSLQDLAISTGPRLDDTWAGQNLGTTEHKSQGWLPLGLQDKRLRVTLREDPLYRGRRNAVIVQEDQAEEPWSLYIGLYTIFKGFKAPPESR